eukprot:5142794-Prymnesium_polylepis.3
MSEMGYAMTGVQSDWHWGDIARECKEKLAYVAADFDEAMEMAARDPESFRKGIENPSGVPIDLVSERFRCAEALFKPDLLGYDSLGLHQLVHEAILAADVPEPYRRQLYGGIVLMGGSALFSGLEQRLARELVMLAPDQEVRILEGWSGLRRHYLGWMGARQLMLSQNVADMRRWVTREEYAAHGCAIAHAKCTLGAVIEDAEIGEGDH